jgi:HD-GYP domain-containing protein (c-di-GMP phosphodiesterase class II)
MIGLRRSRGTLTAVRDETASVLLRILDEREDDLNRHLREVTALVHAVAGRVGLSGERLEILTRAAECHDIGKVAIPDEVLHKQGPLTEDEWKVMREHTVIGERILAAAPSMVPVARVVRSCHERWDGLGYPDRLPGPQIPLESRLIFICDAYDAMVANRPYRQGLSTEQALHELRRHSGTQFDPELVETFCETVGGRERLELAGQHPPALVAVAG